MISYTDDELRALADLYDRTYMQWSETPDDYLVLMENLLIEFKDVQPESTRLSRILLEFLGCYIRATPLEEAAKKYHDILFELPLKEMPKHINGKPDNLCGIIAQWRLSLNK
jgi:hypothetical protein